MVPRATLLVLFWTLAGCATPSGQAVSHWMSSSLGRLRNAVDPDRLVVPEIRRARSLIATAPGYVAREARRPTQLFRGAQRLAGGTLERTSRLPGRGVAAVRRNTAGMERHLAHLVAPDGVLRRTLDPDRQVAAVRRICQRLPTVLGLDRQILPGPGDPDRQTSAHPRGPQETWVEKILRRVRL